jgi:hypothetical protein
MELPTPDPTTTLIVGIAAGIAAPPVRRTVGRGIGYAARGVMAAGAPVINIGRDIYDNARDVASPQGGRTTRRATSASAV